MKRDLRSSRITNRLFIGIKRGAVAREPHAMNNLEAMYERALGVKKDQKKAEYWYAKAREAQESKQFLESPATEIS